MAAEDTLAQLVKAYDGKDYERAQAIGEKLISRHPADYSARYYLANTYVILHKNEEAINQYRICVNSSESGQLKQFSGTALERLLKQKELALMAAQSENKNKNKELEAFQARIRAETREEQLALRKEWNQALERVDSKYGGYHGGGGFSFGGGFGFGFGGGFGRYQNNYANERFHINETYSKRMAELAHHEESMLTQANCGTGKIRLAPSLSSSKVKNYINYGDESEAVDIPVDNPLRAVARALPAAVNKSKTPSKKETPGKNAK